MQLTNQQLGELWRQKLFFYYGREKGGSLGGTFSVLVIFLFMLGTASEFDKEILKFSALFYLVYFFSFVFLDRKIKSIKSSRMPKEKAAVLKILLLAVQDLSVAFIVLVTVISTGSLILASMAKWDFFAEKITTFWFSILIFGMLLSPFRLKYKISRKQSESFKYLPQLLAISTSLPGLMLLIFTVMPISEDVNAKLLLSMILFLVIGIFLVPYFIWELHEVMILSIRPWPKIRKSKADFIISFEDM